MKVRLISSSKPDRGLGFSDLGTAQELIAFCARVSNPSNQYNSETAEKLIGYLIRHQHWSPLEMVSACLEIETTRDIARQILRHRSFSFQEFSQRYADPTQELSFVVREARLQDAKNRQNSVPLDMQDPEQRLLARLWQEKQTEVMRSARSAYQWAVENGIAKEQARAVLPEGLTVSRLYVNGTLRSWVHFIEVRSGNGTQREHMEVARACAVALAEIFPMASDFVQPE